MRSRIAGRRALAISTGAIVAVLLVGYGCGLSLGGLSAPGDDAAAVDDGGVLKPEVCVAVEDCFNGIDDDCNGLGDCADPACADRVACESVPSGWRLAAVAADDACPQGYAEPSLRMLEGPTSGDTCTCACGGPIGNGCTQGTITITWDNTANLDCADGVTPTTAVVDGGCTSITNPGSRTGARVPALGPSTVRCATAATPPAVTYDGGAVVCNGAARGCTGESACAAKGATFCVRHDGDVPCPEATMKRRVLGAADAGVVDSRICGCACSSTPGACTSATVHFYSSTTCANEVAMVNANAACNTLNGAKNNIVAVSYGATPSTTTCAPVAATAPFDGGVTLAAPVTVCCR